MADLTKIANYCAIISRKIISFRYPIIFVFAALTVLSLAGIPHLQVDTSVEGWFLEGDSSLKDKEKFEAIFGNEDSCAVLLTADNIFTEENLLLIRALGDELKKAIPYAADVLSIADLQVTVGTEDGLEVMTLVPKNLEDFHYNSQHIEKIKNFALAKPSIKNRLVSEDGHQAWLVLRLKPVPKQIMENGDSLTQHIASEFVAVIQQEKYAQFAPKAAGLYIADIDKRAFFNKEIPKLLLTALLIVAIVLAVSLRTWRGVIFPLVSAVGSILIVLGIQGHMGVAIDPGILLLPIFLSLTLATCYSIHIFNFFLKEFSRTGNRKEAVVFALAETAWPQFFSSITTVVALLTFLVIPMRPIRWVGVTAACLVLATWLLASLLLPAFLSFGKDKAVKAHAGSNAKSRVDMIIARLSTKPLSYPNLTLGVFATFLIVCSLGVLNMEVSFDIRRTLGPQIPYVERLIQIGESAVGSIYSYGIAITLPQKEMAKEPHVLKNLSILNDEILAFPMTKKTSSLLDIVKDLNQVVNDGQSQYYEVPQTREEVAQLLLLYENAGGTEAEKWVDYNYQSLRLQVEVSDYNSLEILKQFEMLKTRGAELFPGAKIITTGALSNFTVMMDYISWGQISSDSLALLSILLFISFAFGSLKIGIIAMIPNLVPGFVVVAVMGFNNIPLDMMTVTIVPMLLGLAVDDTIHFINHCQIQFSRTGSYKKSIEYTFQTVGRAIFISACVLILGFGSYLFSPANAFQNMALLIAAGISIAFIAECFVTPALLYKTKAFGPETKSNSDC